MSVVILSIYPEIYSTKIAVSEDENIVYQSEIDHSKEDFISFENIMEQIQYRRDAITDRLHKDNVDIKLIQYVVAEGGLLRPCDEGVYHIDKSMVGDFIEGIGGYYKYRRLARFHYSKYTQDKIFCGDSGIS